MLLSVAVCFSFIVPSAVLDIVKILASFILRKNVDLTRPVHRVEIINCVSG